MPLEDRLSAEEMLNRAQTELGARVSDLKLSHGQLDMTCDPASVVEVLKTLRDSRTLRCTFFTFLSAIDRSEFKREGEEEPVGGLEVLIHVYSPRLAIHANVHVPLAEMNPTCPTITGLYLGALWHERETHEMFGIDFPGHPKLAPLYLPEDFVGHPLLKSFKLPSRAHVKEWPGAKDPEEAAAGGR